MEEIINEKLHEPTERLAVDIEESHMGVVTKSLAQRKGKMLNMINNGKGRVRMDYIVPARGLIGFHHDFVIETRGSGLAHHVFEGYEPWKGEIRPRPTGSIVSDRRGTTTTYSLLNLQERGQLFVPPATEVYEGMIIGERNRVGDLYVNITKEKKLTNMRASGSDSTVTLRPPQIMSLDRCIEFIDDDELIEVTPKTIRMRKRELNKNKREKQG